MQGLTAMTDGQRLSMLSNSRILIPGILESHISGVPEMKNSGHAYSDIQKSSSRAGLAGLLIGFHPCREASPNYEIHNGTTSVQ